MCTLLILKICLMCHMQGLGLQNNKIADAGHTAFAKAVESGALANLTHLRLEVNKIGDIGLEALAKAITPDKDGKVALDHLTVCWRPTALIPCLETWHAHFPDPVVLFHVLYAVP